MSGKKHVLLPIFEFIRRLLNNSYKKPTAIYIGCLVLFLTESSKLAHFIENKFSNSLPILSVDSLSFYLISLMVLLSVVLVYMGFGIMRYVIIGSLILFLVPISYNDYSSITYYVFKILAMPLLFLNTTKMWYRRSRPSGLVGLNDPCPCGSQIPFQDCCAVQTFQNMQ